LYQLVYRLLNRNRKWITISMALQHALEREYHLVPHKCLHVHNPVASGTELAPGKVVNEPFTIIYAGSVFDMHFDAILMTGKAIQALNRNYGRNAFELILFTTQSFWQSWQHAFKSADISYGGFVHPDALPVSLSKAELLLVASAYDERYRHMVEASIQTKLTEYMRTGVPILSVGPAYSACHAFLRDWHSGWVFEGTSVDALGAFIEQIKTDKATSDAYCTNALHVVATHFSKPVVQEKLYTFLAEVV
jgi:glycosyltransferase involved in cell wall biosynthesis